MIKNYFKIAFRNLLNNKTYVIINTFGLGIALACCITAYILVAYNIEFNDFHKDEKVEKIFRIHEHVLFKDANRGVRLGAPVILGPMATEDISGISRFTRYAGGSANISFVNESNYTPAFSEGVAFADANFFELFDFPLVSGNNEAFKELTSIFINQDMATKYFGDEDPIGKVLTLNFEREVEKQVVVGGVVDKISINSSFVFNALVRMEHFEELRLLDQQPWADWNIPTIFVELVNPAQASEIGLMFDKYIPIRNEAKLDSEVELYSLQPFKSNVRQDDINWSYVNLTISIEPLIVFVTLAIMIMLIACFNLTNTSIAMTAKRLKEIGVRKSMGANKSQIMLQFLLETVVTLILALIVGYTLSYVIVPEFTSMWDLPYGMEDLNTMNLMTALFIIILVSSLLSGIYPALFSSRLNMVTLLKGSVRVKGTNGLTRLLLVMQFAISVIVLLGGIVFIQNTKFQEDIEFGYDKKSLLTVSVQNEKEFTAMEAKAKAFPKIIEVGASRDQVGNSYTAPIKHEGSDYNAQHLAVAKNYFKTMGFNFVAGEAFDVEKASDMVTGLVVTEQLVKMLNLQGDPIGQQVEVHETKRRITGVIEDFVDNVYRSKDPEPILFYPLGPALWTTLVIKGDPGSLVQINDYMEES
ncbi:MAG: ABC transporter permease, partial [Bacteroidetes bacterium]|nr:ABC transporter permease [Bacteroidota bacterium]